MKVRLHAVRLCIVAMTICSFSCAHGQAPPPSAPSSPTQDTQDSAIDQIKKAVVFIQGDYKKGDEDLNIKGTGFLIAVPEERVGTGQGYLFVVTNKHMIREPDKDGVLGNGPYFRQITLRVDLKKPIDNIGTLAGTAPAQITRPNGDLAVYIDPSDPDVDLALIPIAANQDIVDFKFVPIPMFETTEGLKADQVDETTELFFAGLFAPYLGTKKNYPIVRHGKLAMISDERIPFDVERTANLYLADVMSFGGNSGSPVFVRIGGATDRGLIAGYRYKLLGVMQGYYSVESPVAVDTARMKGAAAENTGVAAVIPAQKILDILASPRFKANMDMRVAEYYASHGRIAESAALYETVINALAEIDPLHSDLSQARTEYAEVLKKQGKFGEAALQQRQAQFVRKDALADDLRK